jgi:hypothetical protein
MVSSKDSTSNQELNNNIYAPSKVSKNFTKTPYQIIDASNILPSARMIWIYLNSNSDDFVASADAIATALGMTKRTVLAAKKKLLEHNMINISKIPNPKGGKKDHIRCQDQSVWVGVEFSNQRSVNIDKPDRLVKKLHQGRCKNYTEVGEKNAPDNREPKYIKEIDSRETPPNSAKKTTPEAGRVKKATTTKFPLVGFYEVINKVTGHATAQERNKMFQAALDKYGPDKFGDVLTRMQTDKARIVWHDPVERTDVNYTSFEEYFDYMVGLQGSG